MSYYLAVNVNNHAAVLGDFPTASEAKGVVDPCGQFSWLDTDDGGATAVVGGMTLSVEAH